MADPNANYHLYSEWGEGLSGEFVLHNPEFTKIKLKAVIEPCKRIAGDGEPDQGDLRITYELEARRPRRLLGKRRNS
jgi:hypothetical protein